MKSAQVVRHGIIKIMARNFGATRKRTGSSAMVSSASISSFTFMVPISAANAEPERPITMIAVINGPSSRVIEMATALATNCMAPSLRSSYAPCRARISADEKGDQGDDRERFHAHGHRLMHRAAPAKRFGPGKVR